MQKFTKKAHPLVRFSLATFITRSLDTQNQHEQEQKSTTIDLTEDDRHPVGIESIDLIERDGHLMAIESI